MDSPEEQLVRELRAIIISSKGGISLRDLQRDYLDLGNSSSMYQKLGFSTLDDFVKSRTSEFRIRNAIVTATIKEESAHIQKLVSQQSGKSGGRSRFSAPEQHIRRPKTGGSSFRTRNGSRQTHPNTIQRDHRKDLTEEEARALIHRDKVIWPKSLFVGDLKAKERNRPIKKEIRPRFQEKHGDDRSKSEDYSRSVANGATKLGHSKDLPFSKFKAKAPVTRQPYQHQHNDSDDDGGVFKVVPDLDDPVMPVNLASMHPVTVPASNKSGLTTSIESKDKPLPPPLMQLQSCLKPTTTKPPEANKPAYLNDEKRKAASRIARLQAEAQSQVKMNAQVELTGEPSYIRERLNELCATLRLPIPDMEIMTTTEKNVKKFWCLIKIGDDVFKSQSSDEITARNRACRQAYEVLLKRLGGQTVAAADESPFILCVKEMLKQKPYMWLEKLAAEYEENFGKAAPPNWLEIITSCPSFSTLTTVMKKELIHLAPQNASLALPETVSHKPEAQRFDEPSKAVAPETALENIPTSGGRWNRLPPLVVPESRYWDLYILKARDPGELISRLYDKELNAKYNDTLETLELEMMDNRQLVVAPQEGELYAIFESGGWFRAKLTRLLLNEQAEVYYLDEGEFDTVCFNQIYYLHDKYLDLAPQALRLCLNGLQSFPVTAQLSKAMAQQLERRTCVCEVVKRLSERADDIRACVVLWDTSTADDINMNSLLMEQVVASFRAPTLPVGTTREMLVAQVGDSIYLQGVDENVDCITGLIEYTMTRPDLEDCFVTSVTLNKVYVVKNPITMTYQRAKCINFRSESDLTVCYIDYGVSAQVAIKDLYDGEKLCKALDICPPQAVQVTLAGVKTLPPKLATVIRPGDLVVVKVVDNEKNIPSVQIYRRSPVEFKSVSEMIQSTEDETRPADEPAGIDKLQDVSVGELLSVVVTLSASPSVFTVQLLNYTDDLMQLMCDLQSAKLSSSHILDPRMLQMEGYYAVFFASKWYRGKLNAVIDGDVVSVELCDFGNIAVVPLENVRQLPAKFQNVPRQALRASLAGVVPINGDWNPSDCVLFQERVLNKELAAYVRGVRKSSDGPVLSLTLIDTSDPQKDVDIAQLLVEQGAATRKPK